MNPFIISGFRGEEFFCNRLKELKNLRDAFENGRNVTMFSLRRMGKSALIHYLFEKLSKSADTIYADVLPAVNFRELTAITASAVTEYFGSSARDFLSKIGALVRSIGATLSFDETTGKPRLRFGIGEINQSQKSFEEIISFLEAKKKRTLLVFDEFQQVRNFPEANTEAILRSIFQKCRKINFIFLGSNRGMMESIFSDASKPFYQSTQFIQLEEIEEEDYSKFIIDKFRAGKQKITEDQAHIILKLCRSHTYYVQHLCNRLYSKKITGKDLMIYETLDEILKENEPVYHNYQNLLTSVQWKLAKAIAKEQKVSEPYADSFIKKHELGAIGTVQRALASLLEKEIITHYKGAYMVYDTFFSLWLRKSVV